MCIFLFLLRILINVLTISLFSGSIITVVRDKCLLLDFIDVFSLIKLFVCVTSFHNFIEEEIH